MEVPADSIAMVTHVGVGKLVYLPFSYSTSQDFVSLSDVTVDAGFLCYALFRKLNSELHIVQSSAIKGTVKFLAHFLTGGWPAVRYGYSSSSDTSR